MSFYGCRFSFNGIPCTEYGLMLYSFGRSDQEESSLSTDIKIVEDRISRRSTPIHYGVVNNTPLEFNMVFGADMDAIDKDVFFDRWDMGVISSWLTGHNTYKWLEITQPDMEAVRYKCFITDLQQVSFGKIPWGFSCKVKCDSPFAYLFPETFTYTVSGTKNFSFYNRSMLNGYYKPKLDITIYQGQQGSDSLSIINHSDGDRTMSFTNIPSSVNTIHIDNENEIITCDGVSNLFPYFNFNFFRLKRGNNLITATGAFALDIVCEFPVGVGG